MSLVSRLQAGWVVMRFKTSSQRYLKSSGAQHPLISVSCLNAVDGCRSLRLSWCLKKMESVVNGSRRVKCKREVAKRDRLAVGCNG
ncbi:hypothetical protein KC367_g100 [Hortaea werneckii]|nr:hypothetical protein KC367_g100 [Hortaea werneckii]